jgi:hypothetical protein
MRVERSEGAKAPGTDARWLGRAERPLVRALPIMCVGFSEDYQQAWRRQAG